MEGSKLLIVGLVLAICALIFQVIGLASPYWIALEVNSWKINFGLLKYCFQIPTSLGDTTTCLDTTEQIKEGIWLNAFFISHIFFYVTKKYIFTEMKLLIISDCYIIYVIPLWCIFLSFLFFYTNRYSNFWRKNNSFYRLVGCCKGDEHSGIDCTFNIGSDDNVEIVCHEGEQDSSICGDLHGLCWR